jgi:hypothetical protein
MELALTDAHGDAAQDLGVLHPDVEVLQFEEGGLGHGSIVIPTTAVVEIPATGISGAIRPGG